MQDETSLRGRNSALRAEFKALAGGENDLSPYENLRARHEAVKDAKNWAQKNDVPTALFGSQLIARRADVAAALAVPARESIHYTTTVTGDAKFESRAAAAEAERVALGWKTIALSHDIEMPEVTAYETEELAVRVDPFDPRPRQVRATGAEHMKITVTERALLQRINRALKAEGEMVKRCPESSRDFGDLGTYYSIDVQRNFITARHIDLAVWGRELGALKAWERVVE